MKNLGHKLKTLREFHNYKQQFIAEHLGIGQSAYSRIENGNVMNLSLNHVQSLAELYDLRLDVLLTDTKALVLSNDTCHVLGQNPEDIIKKLEEKVEFLLQGIKTKTKKAT